jgi:glycosyl hydrolase family 59
MLWGCSADGSEPSHQHTRGDINCDVGYEFWLGEQAVARNPGIKLVALPWTAPGWVGGR